MKYYFGNYVFILMILLINSFALACLAEPAAPLAPISKATVEVPTKAIWEVEWEALEKAAKNEGDLMIYAQTGPDVQNVIRQVFKEKYLINVDFFAARAGELVERILRERRANIYSPDIYISGTTTAIAVLKPAGILESMEKVLVLPEVLDPKVWWDGRLPWVDKDYTMLNFRASPRLGFIRNTEMVSPTDITSWRDLLDPKWKGRITLTDPTEAGGGSTTIAELGMYIMDIDFIRQLAKQEPVLTRDQRLHVEWVAKGKYPIGIGTLDEQVISFIRAGAPIAIIVPKEGVAIQAGTSSFAIINKAPHPNAARLFINWALSQQGATTLSKALGLQSGRVDVPTDFLEPYVLRKTGEKYHAAMDDIYALKKSEYVEISKEIFGHLLLK